MPLIAIAKTSILEIIRQPIFRVVTIIGLILIFCSQYLTLFVLGQETATIIDTSMSTLLTSGILIAIFSANSLIYQEIESKAILTILSKPVQRSQILIGKFAGILISIFIMSTIFCLCILLTAWMSTKANNDRVFDTVIISYILSMAAVTLFQLIVLTAVSVLCATTMPVAMTASFTLLVFFLGHQQDYFLLMLDSESSFNILAEIYKLVIPNLEFYNLNQQLYTDTAVPFGYTIGNMIYSVIYVAIYLLTAIIFFQRRDFS